MPDFFGVYQLMEVREYLEFVAAAYALPRETRRRTVDEVLALLDLGGKANDLVGTLSRGMQQRLGLGRVLIHDPKVLLLDEPASGLRRLGKTIVLSSHILSDVEEVCDAIGILERGSLLFAGPVAEALGHARGERVVSVQVRRGETDRAHAALAAHPHAASVEPHGEDRLEVRIAEGCPDHGFVVEALVRSGIGVLAVREREVELEDAFLRLTKGSVA
jgi:ABC-2 type transport system ATP-binding protein